jgi:hypothetical protein
MAISPSKPDFFDGTWRGKMRVWVAPTISAGGDTVVVSGIKRVFGVTVGNRPTTTFTYTTTAAGNSAVMLTVTVTASCTGSTATPMVVYGQ